MANVPHMKILLKDNVASYTFSDVFRSFTTHLIACYFHIFKVSGFIKQIPFLIYYRNSFLDLSAHIYK